MTRTRRHHLRGRGPAVTEQRPAALEYAIAQIIQDTFDRVSTPQIAPGRVPGGRERAAAEAILASVIFRDPADVWDEAMSTARTIINRRTSTYEADIDLLAEPNPYRSEGSTK